VTTETVDAVEAALTGVYGAIAVTAVRRANSREIGEDLSKALSVLIAAAESRGIQTCEAWCVWKERGQEKAAAAFAPVYEGLVARAEAAEGRAAVLRDALVAMGTKQPMDLSIIRRAALDATEMPDVGSDVAAIEGV